MSTPPSLRVAYREFVFYKAIWKANLMGAVVQPLLYLLGVGVGVGSLVDRGQASGEVLGGSSYLAFYSTALLATTVMFTSSQEALWPTMDGFNWSNAYRAMAATPVRPADVAAGIAVHHAARALIGASGVAVVLLLFDETRTFGLLAAIPAAVLCGLAFAVPLTAWTASQTTDKSFPPIMRFVILPLFLFSGAFFPVEQLPDWMEPIAWATPLWHGVELCRGAVLGGLGLTMTLVHVAVLGSYISLGWVAGRRAFAKRLGE